MRLEIPHPVTQITIWVALAIVVQSLQTVVLPVVTSALIIIAYKTHSRRLMTLLRRTRWIIFSLLIIYAFMTPGVGIWTLPYLPSPTREGLLDGLMQLGRLFCVLAGLSILLTSLSQVRLISGLYTLSYPLRFFGVSRERVAVRLALTLHYAEKAMEETAKDWRSGIERSLEPEKDVDHGIELPVQTLTRIDGLLIIAMGAALIWPLIGLWR